MNQEFKVLVTGLPRNFLVEPGILGKIQEVSQEVLGKIGTSWLTFPTNLPKTFKICCITDVIVGKIRQEVPALPGTS